MKRLALFFIIASVSSGIGWAQVCSGVPDCELQQQAGVSYNADQTRGWAYYCSGDHPYYWGASWAGLSGQWVQTNKCFTTLENTAAEGQDPGKLDVTVTNWCAKKEEYTISLACSPHPPPLWNESCTNTTTWVDKDPKCPTVPNSTKTLKRSISGVPLFFEMWVEQCSNNLYWNCSSDQGLLQCSSCTGKTGSTSAPQQSQSSKRATQP